MRINHISIGKKGEEFACKIIEGMGYKVLERNYRCNIGEIDLIALDGDVLVFIEIKTRSRSIEYAKEAVNRKKMKKLSLLASYYIKKKRLQNPRVRFDVIAVHMSGKHLEFEYIRNAFTCDG